MAPTMVSSILELSLGCRSLPSIHAVVGLFELEQRTNKVMFRAHTEVCLGLAACGAIVLPVPLLVNGNHIIVV